MQHSNGSKTSMGNRLDSLSWVFRTNLPPRRGEPYPSEPHKRNLFGIGEIVNVITNPADTVRSLAESRRLLEEARKQIRENRERVQIRLLHNFTSLPGYFRRSIEQQALERALSGQPSFTVLFGACSVGKTALLRQVLANDKYHVLHFDLRIAGFADLTSLYISLSQQMEQYFDSISIIMDGYEDFEREAWAFKHDRLPIERQIEAGATHIVKTSDVARLMELFQSSLSRYWQYDPSRDNEASSEATKIEYEMPRLPLKERLYRKSEDVVDRSPNSQHDLEKTPFPLLPKEPTKTKKIPVLFFDEAHKLPTLIQSTETMKCLLDSMVVLTKQDRLCHVVHATSDCFYQTWLRQLNVIQHCKIISIGDCSKAEIREFYRQRLFPSVPEELRRGLDFEALYNAFGGKIAHWQDYISDFINAGGDLTIKRSSHFMQAHALLNMHVIHAGESEPPPGRTPSRRGFTMYSTLPTPSRAPSRMREERPPHHPTPDPMYDTNSPPGCYNGGVMDYDPAPSYTAIQLLKVMRKLSESSTTSLPYFLLCRELGVKSVNDMIRGRILELRWMDVLTREGGEEDDLEIVEARDSVLGLDAMSPSSVGGVTGVGGPTGEGLVGGVKTILGPKVVPITPITRYAMREVLKEYDFGDDDEGMPMPESSVGPPMEEDSRSEYASLSEVDEY